MVPGRVATFGGLWVYCCFILSFCCRLFLSYTSYFAGSPSCLRMGSADCELPHHDDQIDGDDVPPNDSDMLVIAAEPPQIAVSEQIVEVEEEFECEIPRYADRFSEYDVPPNDFDSSVIAPEHLQGMTTNQVIGDEARVVEPNAAHRSRSLEVASARAKKRVSTNSTGSVPLISAAGSGSRKRHSRNGPPDGPSAATC